MIKKLKKSYQSRVSGNSDRKKKIIETIIINKKKVTDRGHGLGVKVTVKKVIKNIIR